MQAVILAGGYGSRLRPLTYKIPKSMIPILEKPYLCYQLEFLSRQGITDILMLTGYLGDQIEEYFKDGSSLGLRIVYSRETEPLGTGGALKKAEPLLGKNFFIINGDTYLPLNYDSVEAKFLESDKKGLIVIYENRPEKTGVSGNISIDDSSLVTDYFKSKNYTGLKYVDTGVSVFKREALELLPRDTKVMSLEEEIFPMLIQKRELTAYITGQRFYDIGARERIKHFERFLKNDNFQNAV